MGEIEEKIEEKIPKDLKRWLKDNGHFTEFIRLIKRCGYSVSDLSHKYLDENGKLIYGITNWFNDPVEKRWVQSGKDKASIKYDHFLNELGLNWNQK
jgi:hypothetical protein